MCVQHNSSSKLVVVARPSYSSRLSENEADEKALKELQKALKDPQDPIYSELYIAGNFSVRKLPFQAAIQFTCEPGDLEFPEEGMRKLASRFPDLEFAVRYEIATDHFET
jgi:lauroyl/myristoyl acyltransferase